jgi:hypothetical protein
MSQPARRTVVITGRPDKGGVRPVREAAPRPSVSLPARGPRIVQIDRRRPPRRPVERLGPRPDRIAMWAVVMALFLILVTIASSH